MASSFSKVHSIPAEWSTNVNFVEKYGDTYYLCFPGSGIYKTKDFETFETVWKYSSIGGFMIDHNGFLYTVVSDALGSGQPAMLYWKEKD